MEIHRLGQNYQHCRFTAELDFGVGVTNISPCHLCVWLHHCQYRRNKFESEGVGGTRPAQSAGFFFRRSPPLFGSTSTINHFVERFRDGQYSLVSFLFAVFFYSRCRPRAQPFVKVLLRGACPHALWSGATYHYVT